MFHRGTCFCLPSVIPNIGINHSQRLPGCVSLRYIILLALFYDKYRDQLFSGAADTLVGVKANGCAYCPNNVC